MGLQGEALDFRLLLIGEETGVVQAQQHVALVHHLTLAHEDFRDDAAFEVLDCLHLARRNGLALAGGDFVEHGEMRPGQPRGDQQCHQPYRQPADPRRILEDGAL